MIKVGDLFFTATGRVGKVVAEFNYGDTFKFMGAIFDGTRWLATRFNEHGQAIDGTGNNVGPSLDDWMNYYSFSLKYNVVDKTWEGVGAHVSNITLGVRIVQYDKPEKVLIEMKKAAYDKMVEFLKPLGYPLEMKDAE